MAALRDALAPPVQVATPTGLVAKVHADGTVDLDLGAGQVLPSCPVLESYTPATGHAVAVAVFPDGQRLVLGRIRTSNATTQTIMTELAFPYNVLPAAAAPTLTVSASGSGSWRSADGWAYLGTKVAQGAYTPSYGYYRGLWAYGVNAFPGGGTATAATIRLGTRLAGSGSGSAVDVWVAPHVHDTIPAVEPFFPVAAEKIGTVAVGASPTLPLPLWIAQGLLDGIYRGVGLVRLSQDDYLQLNGVPTEAASGQIVITRS